MQITPVMEKFILHWGEMGTRWGVNRTVAQIHALLYLSTDPINAEEIAETLGVARSNVSTSLKELQGWGLIKVVHVMGDRRDHFKSLKDVWDIFMVIMDERKKRELDPTLTMLRECKIDANSDSTTPDDVKNRISETLKFIELTTRWYDQVKGLPRPTLIKLMKFGAHIQNFLTGTSKR